MDIKRPNKGEKYTGTLADLKDYTVIDLETTGLDPELDMITEVAAVRVRNGEIVDHYASLVHSPGVIIYDYIEELTGITQEMVEAAPDISTILPEYIDFIGNDIVIGHNVNFDINFLYDNCEEYLGKSFSNDHRDTCPIARCLILDAENHKLAYLTEFLNIDQGIHHRALADCYSTKALFDILVERDQVPKVNERDVLKSVTEETLAPLKGQNIVFKGNAKLYAFDFYKRLANMGGAKIGPAFFRNKATMIVLVTSKYNALEKYRTAAPEEKDLYDRWSGHLFGDIIEREKSGQLVAMSEAQFCELIQIPVPTRKATKKAARAGRSGNQLSVKDIEADTTDFDENHPLYGKVTVFTGALSNMTRAVAWQLVVNCGGIIADSVTKKTNYLVLGSLAYARNLKGNKSGKLRDAENKIIEGQDLEIISESVFLEMVFSD